MLMRPSSTWAVRRQVVAIVTRPSDRISAILVDTASPIRNTPMLGKWFKMRAGGVGGKGRQGSGGGAQSAKWSTLFPVMDE